MTFARTKSPSKQSGPEHVECYYPVVFVPVSCVTCVSALRCWGLLRVRVLLLLLLLLLRRLPRSLVSRWCRAGWYLLWSDGVLLVSRFLFLRRWCPTRVPLVSRWCHRFWLVPPMLYRQCPVGVPLFFCGPAVVPLMSLLSFLSFLSLSVAAGAVSRFRATALAFIFVFVSLSGTTFVASAASRTPFEPQAVSCRYLKFDQFVEDTRTRRCRWTSEALMAATGTRRTWKTWVRFGGVRCVKCGMKGHIDRDCRGKGKRLARTRENMKEEGAPKGKVGQARRL